MISKDLCIHLASWHANRPSVHDVCWNSLHIMASLQHLARCHANCYIYLSNLVDSSNVRIAAAEPILLVQAYVCLMVFGDGKQCSPGQPCQLLLSVEATQCCAPLCGPSTADFRSSTGQSPPHARLHPCPPSGAAAAPSYGLGPEAPTTMLSTRSRLATAKAVSPSPTLCFPVATDLHGMYHTQLIC